MGRRCSKKAVRCGAIGVVLACASVDFSLAGPDAALRRDFSAVPWHPPGRVLGCPDRVFVLFAVRVMPVFPEIVLHGRQCPASAPARLPDTLYVLQHISIIMRSGWLCRVASVSACL